LAIIQSFRIWKRRKKIAKWNPQIERKEHRSRSKTIQKISLFFSTGANHPNEMQAGTEEKILKVYSEGGRLKCCSFFSWKVAQEILHRESGRS